MPLIKNKTIVSALYRRVIAPALAVLFLLPLKNLYPSYNDDFGSGAKILSMGGVGVSIGDDIYSSLLNPAALAYLKRGQLAFEYGRLHINLSDKSEIGGGFAGIAWPFIKEEILEDESVGKTSTETAKTSGKIIRTLSSSVMLGYKNLNLAGSYSENTFRLTYARFFGKRFAIGVSAKVLSDEFIMDEYLRRSSVFEYGQKNSGNSYTADIGFIWNPWPRFFAGISGQDVTEPEIGYLVKEKLPATYRMGLGMRKSDSRYALDISWRPTSPSKEIEAAAGFEKTYRDKISLRSGFTWSRVSDGFQSWRASAGVGFNISETITLDYALIYPLSDLKETYGSHYISFAFQFGRSESSEELEPGSLERAYRELSEEKFRLENRLAKTETEKRKLEEVLIEEATSRIREKIKQTRESAQTAAATQQKTDTTRGSVDIKNIAASRTHIVKKGETLQSLAEKYYNDSKLWIEIYNANRDDIGRGGALKVNQVLIIPPPPATTPSAIQPLKETQPISTPQSAAPTITEIKILPTSLAPTDSTAKPQNPQEGIAEKPLLIPVEIEKIEIATTTATAPQPSAKTTATKPTPAPQQDQSSKKLAQSAKKTHTVKPGENLRSIAEKYYNNPEKWRIILEANKDKVIRGYVRPGTELVIP